MTHYATCFNCAVDKSACSRRAELQKALAGSHVTSVKFRCPDRQPHFTPGQRVAFDWKVWETDGDEESCIHLTFHGTVLQEKGSKFVVQVDAGKDATLEEIDASDVFKRNDALITKVRPADMLPLNEPPRSVCLTCYQIEGMDGIRCYRSQGQVWKPKGCIMPDGGTFKVEEYPF